MRILVVEDEVQLAGLIGKALELAGHAVDVVHSGEDALDWIDDDLHDAMVLDVMLPGIDGVAVCRAMRARGMKTPVLLLTARDAVADRVAGLDAGADDYLVKPFAMAELGARLRALERRPRTVTEAILVVGDVRLDPATRQVWVGQEAVSLHHKEFQILEYMMRRQGHVLTRDMIGQHVWDYDFPGASNVIDVHIRSLRLKLRDPYPGRLIQTVRGAGYRLTPRQ